MNITKTIIFQIKLKITPNRLEILDSELTNISTKVVKKYYII